MVSWLTRRYTSTTLSAELYFGQFLIMFRQRVRIDGQFLLVSIPTFPGMEITYGWRKGIVGIGCTDDIPLALFVSFLVLFWGEGGRGDQGRGGFYSMVFRYI